MSPSAQRIYINFVRLVGEEGASLYFDQFLRAGARRLPQSTLRRLPALRQWRGVASLKKRLGRLAGAMALTASIFLFQRIPEIQLEGTDIRGARRRTVIAGGNRAQVRIGGGADGRVTGGDQAGKREQRNQFLHRRLYFHGY